MSEDTFGTSLVKLPSARVKELCVKKVETVRRRRDERVAVVCDRYIKLHSRVGWWGRLWGKKDADLPHITREEAYERIKNDAEQLDGCFMTSDIWCIEHFADETCAKVFNLMSLANEADEVYLSANDLNLIS